MIEHCMNFVRKFGHWLLEAVRIQLMLTAASLPMLNAWGLPVSSLGLIGNLLFAPVVAVFLGAGFLFMLAAVFGLPTTMLGRFLDWHVDQWYTLLQLAPHAPTLATPAFPVVLSIGSALGFALFLYLYAARLTWWQEVGVYLVSIALWLVMGALWHHEGPRAILIGSGSRALYACEAPEGRVVLIDAVGALPRGDRVHGWGTWVARTELVRAFGSVGDVVLLLCRPSESSLEAACKLLALGVVSRVELCVDRLSRHRRMAAEECSREAVPEGAVTLISASTMEERYGAFLKELARFGVQIDKRSERCNTPVGGGSASTAVCRVRERAHKDSADTIK